MWEAQISPYSHYPALLESQCFGQPSLARMQISPLKTAILQAGALHRELLDRGIDAVSLFPGPHGFAKAAADFAWWTLRGK
jgi:hypothetical protein